MDTIKTKKFLSVKKQILKNINLKRRNITTTFKIKSVIYNKIRTGKFYQKNIVLLQIVKII
jgi:hypothetical protein